MIIVQKEFLIPKKTIIPVFLELEQENMLNFIRSREPILSTTKQHIFSQKISWYWITIGFAIATTVSVFVIPDNEFPIFYVRYVLGLLSMLFLPGFALVRALFSGNVPIKLSSKYADTAEQIALSIGFSVAFTPIIGLILNYTYWGIRLIPITLSLLALTIVFASVALIRENKRLVVDSS